MLLLGIISATASADMLLPGTRANWSGTRAKVSRHNTEYTTEFCNVRTSIPGSQLTAKGDGVTDDSAAIQAAINLAPDFQVVHVPAGNYLITTGLVIQHPILLRGDGPGTTVFLSNLTSGTCISMQGGPFAYTGSSAPLYTLTPTADVQAGVSSVTFTTAPGYGVSPGRWIALNSIADTSGTYWKGYGEYSTPSQARIRQLLLITDVQGNTITFDSPLLFNHPLSASPTFMRQDTTFTKGAGIESLTVRQIVPSSANNIGVNQLNDSWIYMVESDKCGGWHLGISNSARVFVSHCYIHGTHTGGGYGGGNSDYGVCLNEGTTECVVEDNIFYYTRHAMLTQNSAQGNIFAYNYSKDTIDQNQDNTDTLVMTMGTHGQFAMFNLWEGNIGAHMEFDDYLGGCCKNTSFRNHATGESLGKNNMYFNAPVEVQADCLDNNLVGNILGMPDIIDNEAGYALSYGYRLGVGYQGESQIFDDRIVSTTPIRTLMHRNYNYMKKGGKGIDVVDGYDTTLPKSLYLVAQPAWWDTSLTWPSIDPDSPDTVTNPAKKRYDAGTPFAVTSSDPAPAPPKNLRRTR